MTGSGIHDMHATELKINLSSLTSQQLEKYGIPIIWD